MPGGSHDPGQEPSSDAEEVARRRQAELDELTPPSVALRLDPDGLGSRDGLVEYVRTALAHRRPDMPDDQLAEAIVTSVLSRLGAGVTIATGAARVRLVANKIEE